MSPDILRVALHSGVLVRHDAISNSLRQKLDVLAELRAGGLPVEWRAFVHDTDIDRADIRVMPRTWQAIRDSWRASASVHVYEFGIHYPLFDAVFTTPPGTTNVGVFHNVTPVDLVDDSGGRAAVERSLVQLNNLWRCDEVVCVSEFSRSQLVDVGFPSEQLVVLPLPAAQAVSAARGDSDRAELVTLLYVGRFVRAKGILDLLDAAARAVSLGGAKFRLVVVGELRFSDADIITRIRDAAAAGPLAGVLRFEPGLPDPELARAYARADALIMPSYHEGYCVPVVEALAAGCHVVAYDSSNLPFVTGGLANLVPTGDVGALAAAIRAYVDRATAARSGARMLVSTRFGDLDEATWKQRVRALLDGRSHAAFARGVAAMLERAAARVGRPEWPSPTREVG